MDKKTATAIWITLLIIVPIIYSDSIPRFLSFQGHAKIDGRPAPQGTPINFSIQETELANSTVDNKGQYERIFIQGFPKFYGNQINITINGTESEQKINYIGLQNIYLNLSALTEKALKISESSPANSKIEIQKTGAVTFNVSTATGYEDEVNHSWFLDGKKIKPDKNDANFSSFNYEINNTDNGERNINVFITDGFLNVFKEWILVIIRPQTENFDGSTTDFLNLELNDLDDIKNAILEKTGKGKIEFLESLNLSGVADLDNKVKIENGIVAIDSSFYQLNKRARITLTGLSYTTIPKVFYSADFTTNANLITGECDFCTILNYSSSPANSGTVVFEVEHFSSFKVAGGEEKYDMELFDNLDKCENGAQGNLTVNIRSPDGGNNFKAEEEMEIEAKITNDADEDKKIIVEAILYNINKNKKEENTETDSKKIKKGKTEIFDLSLSVPEDFDDDNNYILFVKTYEKNNEESQCDYEIIDINLDREKHDVIVKNILISSSDIYFETGVELIAEIKNVGAEDEEDVYVSVTSKALGIFEKTETFDIDEGDSVFKSFNIKIPNNVSGEYKFDVEVAFNDGKNSKSETFLILSDEKGVLKLEAKKTIMLKNNVLQEKSSHAAIKDFDFEKHWLLYFIVILIVGIVILIVGGFVAVRIRKKE